MKILSCSTGKGVSLEDFTILDSIKYCSTAWNNVTSKTIANCWIKTGILPRNNVKNAEIMQTQEMKDARNNITAEQKSNEEILDQLIHYLVENSDITDPMEACGKIYCQSIQ